MCGWVLTNTSSCVFVTHMLHSVNIRKTWILFSRSCTIHMTQRSQKLLNRLKIDFVIWSWYYLRITNPYLDIQMTLTFPDVFPYKKCLVTAASARTQSDRQTDMTEINTVRWYVEKAIGILRIHSVYTSWKICLRSYIWHGARCIMKGFHQCQCNSVDVSDMRYPYHLSGPWIPALKV